MSTTFKDFVPRNLVYATTAPAIVVRSISNTVIPPKMIRSAGRRHLRLVARPAVVPADQSEQRRQQI